MNINPGYVSSRNTCDIFIVRQVTYLEKFIERHKTNGQIIVLGAADWRDIKQTGKKESRATFNSVVYCWP